METIKVYVGTEEYLRDGRCNNLTRPVEFEGEKLAELTIFGQHKGKPADTRGTTEQLYRAADGRYVVHVKDWSKWQGEAEHYYLYEAALEDLGPTGRFAELGQEAGLSRPLPLDEALAG